MKKYLLIIPSILLIASCGSKTTNSSLMHYENSFSIEEINSAECAKLSESFEEYLNNMKTLQGDQSYENYLKAKEICDKFLNNYDTNVYKVIEHTYTVAEVDQWNEKSNEMSQQYWEKQTELMKALKNVLNDETNYNYYSKKIDNCDFYKSLDENKFYISKDYKNLDFNKMNTLGEEIKTDIDISSISTDDLNAKLDTYDSNMGDLIDNLRLSEIQANVLADNEEIQDLSTSYNSKYNDTLNCYKEIFKNSLLNEKYKDSVIEYFELTPEDVEYFVNVEIYDEAKLALFNQETNLVSEFQKAYNMQDSSFDFEQNYIDLINVRNQIASKFGYENYYEYAFKEDYNRDYTVANSQSLTKNIVENKKIWEVYGNLYTSYKQNVSSLTNQFISESELFTWLKQANTISNKVDNALLELKTYGNYNYEFRTNKYEGSYVSTMDKDSNRFMFISRTGMADDLSTISHEFGHYLALTQNDPELEGDNYSLDICEVHSQGLEFLMIQNYESYFSQKNEEAIAKKMAIGLGSMQLLNAIWTLTSGSAVASFEEYAYTNVPTKESLTTKFAELFQNINPDLSYSDIPHIYQSPAYYISYVTSCVSALQLFTMDFNVAKEKYATIINYGETNGFLNVLTKVGMTSPFTNEAFSDVVNKLEIIANEMK